MPSKEAVTSQRGRGRAGTLVALSFEFKLFYLEISSYLRLLTPWMI